MAIFAVFFYIGICSIFPFAFLVGKFGKNLGILNLFVFGQVAYIYPFILIIPAYLYILEDLKFRFSRFMGFTVLIFLVFILQATFFYNSNYGKFPNYLVESIRWFSGSFGVFIIIVLLFLLFILLVFEELFDDLLFKKDAKRSINYIDLDEFLTKKIDKIDLKEKKNSKKELKIYDIQSEVLKSFEKLKPKVNDLQSDIVVLKPKKLKINSCNDEFKSQIDFKDDIFIDLQKSVNMRDVKTVQINAQVFKDEK